MDLLEPFLSDLSIVFWSLTIIQVLRLAIWPLVIAILIMGEEFRFEKIQSNHFSSNHFS